MWRGVIAPPGISAEAVGYWNKVLSAATATNRWQAVLTEKYWATFPDLPARDLARTLGMVRTHGAETLPEVGLLPPEEQLALEQANIEASIVYARDELGV